MIKKKKRIILLVMAMSCTVAIAAECVIGSVVLPEPINIGFSKMGSSDAWSKIASALKTRYGDAYKNLEGSVKVNVKLAIAPAPVFIDMPKACDETLEKTAKELSEAAEIAGDGGDGGDGSGGGGGGGSGPPPGGGGPGGPGCIYGCGNPIVDVGDVEQA